VKASRRRIFCSFMFLILFNYFYWRMRRPKEFDLLAAVSFCHSTHQHQGGD
jgi:hypothetical protein